MTVVELQRGLYPSGGAEMARFWHCGLGLRQTTPSYGMGLCACDYAPPRLIAA